MKFIHLAYENIGEQSKTIDFGNKIGGCIALSDISGKSLGHSLSLALYGAEGNYEGIALPAKIMLKFESNSARYTLIRIFEAAKDGSPSEQAVLSDFDETAILAEGAPQVNGYLADKLELTKRAFDKLFLLDRAAATAALTADAPTRESYIAEVINGITTLDEIVAKTEALKASEKNLLEHIDSVEPVTRKAVKEQQTIASADKVEVDTINNAIGAVHADLAKAARYDDDLAKYYAEAGKLEKLAAKQADFDQSAKFNADCRQAIAISGIFTDYQTEQKKAEGLKTSLEAKKSERAALSDKIKDGEQSAKSLELKFVYHNEKTAELDKKMRELLAATAQDPDSLKIDGIIDGYYAATAKQLAELEANAKAFEADCGSLSEACKALQVRKLDLRNSATYKKAIADGAVMEARISRLNTEMTAANTSILKHEKEQLELYEQNIAQIDRIRELQLRYKELDDGIRKGKNTRQEAIDGVVLYSQSLYAKHIIAASYEADIKALDQKIDKLTKTNDNFSSKRDVIAKRKNELGAHIEKLEAKRKLLTDKLTEYIGYNRLKDYSDNIEYGSHCPICDAYVTYKKDLPVKDTGLIQEQIDIVTAEIDKDKQGIEEARNAISQYDTNLSISSQYAVALQETKKQKQACIDAILADFGFGTIIELYEATVKAAEDYKKLLRDLGDFHEVDAELRRLQENNNLVVNSYNKLAKEIIPAEKETYAAFNKELTEIVAEYEKLQPVFNGENAEDLLPKLQIIDREYEAIEAELEGTQKKLDEAVARRDQNQALLTTARDKAAPVIHKGSRYSYKQVVVKSVAETFNAILAEIDQNDEQKEVAKMRLAGIRKLLGKYNTQLAGLDVEIAGIQAAIDTATQTAEGIFAQYKERFDALGIKTAEDLAALTPEASVLQKREKEVADFRNELIRTQKTTDDLAESIAANQGFFDELGNNKALLASLESKLQEAIARYVVSSSKLDKLTSCYNELVASNRKLSSLQEKLRALEELSSAISEGAVIAKDFAKLVVERANKKVRRWTSDKYSFEINAAGQIGLINNLKAKSVSPSKFNKEEKMLLGMGLSTAFGSALTDLVVTDLPHATVIGIEETDKPGLGILLEASKEKDIIVLPEDDNMFLKAIGKLV